jgi:endonuclease G
VQRRNRFRTLLAETGRADYARDAMERIIGGNDLVSINYLERGMRSARAVCRIRLRNAHGETTGFATGFLVGSNVLMTNHHVIASAEEARHAIAEFDYELDARGRQKECVQFALLGDPEPIAADALDFCLVGVEPRSMDGARALEEFGSLRLDPTPGKGIVGEYLTIIQHPGGERKQICVRENKLLKYDENNNTIWYQTDTVGGSSGSPVFNTSWQIVALHHSGIPRTNANGEWLTTDGVVWDSSMDESRVAWLANEGVRVSAIMEYLAANAADHPLARAVAARAELPVLEDRETADTPATGQSVKVVDGEMRVMVPIYVGIRVGSPGGAAAVAIQAAQGTSDTALQVAAPAPVEKVTVNQANYDERPGYRIDFLGIDVPLPRLEKPDAVLLPYWNYSVLMSTERRLAYFSAVNVDAGQRPRGAGRDGDRWYFDKRLPEEQQLGPKFYGEQRRFEAADRDSNPFDRGHLTRRLDAQWGSTAALQKRNGDDSFHWTNCAPQHWRYNQGSKRWLGLEDFVMSAFAGDTMRSCVFNGPVFDAPWSTVQRNRVRINVKGRRADDPTFGEVAIPKMFFKIVACRKGNALAVAAFLMSQEDFLTGVDRIRGMPEDVAEKLTASEARMYQVRLADIARLTGLDFGPLRDGAARLREAAVADEPVPIVDYTQDVVLTGV